MAEQIHSMVESFSTSANPLNATSIWGRWWLRVGVAAIHLTILLWVMLLTPYEYDKKLGFYCGGIVLVGTLMIWVILGFAKTRAMILLASCLAIAQISIVGLVVFQFRAEAQVLAQIKEEQAQRQKNSAAAIRRLGLDEISDVLMLKQDFNAEDLPRFLEVSRRGRLMLHAMTEQNEEWAREAEKRIAAVDSESAAEFHQGLESTREESKRAFKLSDENLKTLENMIRFLMTKRGLYSVGKDGFNFALEQDADDYDKMAGQLNQTQAEIEDLRKKFKSE